MSRFLRRKKKVSHFRAIILYRSWYNVEIWIITLTLIVCSSSISIGSFLTWLIVAFGSIDRVDINSSIIFKMYLCIFSLINHLSDIYKKMKRAMIPRIFHNHLNEQHKMNNRYVFKIFNGKWVSFTNEENFFVHQLMK